MSYLEQTFFGRGLLTPLQGKSSGVILNPIDNVKRLSKEYRGGGVRLGRSQNEAKIKRSEMRIKLRIYTRCFGKMTLI